MSVTNTNPNRAGALTSEFWMTIAITVANGLLAQGLLSQEQVEPFVQAVVSVVSGLLTLLALIAYINGRIQLKREIVRNSSQQTQVLENVPLQDTPVETLSPQVIVE